MDYLLDDKSSSKIEYKLYWSDDSKQIYNLRFDKASRLYSIDSIIISFSSTFIRQYQLKQDEKIIPWTPSTTSHLTLDKLLKNFFKEDVLDGDYDCSKCKKKTQAKQKTQLCLPLPQILIIQLKRFTYDQCSSDKIDILIEYPVYNLNLNHYAIVSEETDETYDLIAISNHSGLLSFGHYVTYAKNNQTQKWYLFNDDSIQEIDEHELITKNAYILIYMKKQNKSLLPSSLSPITTDEQSKTVG
ncbi:unnamed protein product [Didymodactylos carnosus]|uniref:ubiquitinyl hydrolase 1 n=1 Tax=Didymodactylos carnosus TaxID=1234261 RepID=A0A815U3V7_9BILA|nr:unnamed protein product [Didymodactylos carnosus]CAF4371859.1 unnamed protein product [Didymodactylos carnosus]